MFPYYKINVLGLFIILSILMFPETARAAACSSINAQWTILVYLNGDNSLEPEAFLNFRQMAKIGSSDAVNIVAQFARLGNDTDEQPVWRDAHRFCIKVGTRPVPSDAILDAGIEAKDLDMGSQDALERFVSWGQSRFPAKHYMLIIWDHGQGWRNMTSPNPALRESLSGLNASPIQQITSTTRIGWTFRSTLSPPYKSVSEDDRFHDILHNDRIEKALAEALGGKKLDILGFDACFMQMIETAYAMRNVAKIQVGSEEEEPGYGWKYDDWIRSLEANPRMDERQLAQVLVQSYQKTYSVDDPDPTTTLSAFDVTKVKVLANDVSAWATALTNNMAAVGPEISAARAQTLPFGPSPTDPTNNGFFGIDLHGFATTFDRNSGGIGHHELSQVLSDLQMAIIANYAGTNRTGPFGGFGLAIYFPATLAEYRSDAFAESGYEPSNTVDPVDFVSDQEWSTFLHKFWATL